MGNILPVLKTPTPNTKPLANSRVPGELWVNFPDLQLGLIDPTAVAVPLIAVRYFSAVTAYSSGDFVLQGGHLYAAKSAVPAGVFNPTQWTAMQTAVDVAATLVGYLPLTGGTLSGALNGPAITLTGALAAGSVTATNAVNGATGNFSGTVSASTFASKATGLVVDGANGTQRWIYGSTAAKARWGVILASQDPESGSNTGSNFGVARLDDGGNYVDSPMLITRSNGLVTLNPTQINGNAVLNNGALYLDTAAVGDHTIVGRVGGKFRWQMRLGVNIAESGGDAGSDFYIDRFNDAGSYTGNVLVLSRSNGSASFTGFATFGNASGIQIPSGMVRCAYGNNGIGCATGGQYLAVNGSSGFGNVGQATIIINGGGRSTYMTEFYNGTLREVMIGGDGSLYINGAAFKPGGGAWLDSSDARIKNVTGDYTKGLDDVLKLRPVTFTYKGNDTESADLVDQTSVEEGEEPLVHSAGAPYPASRHYRVATERKSFVGFVAQELETIFPDMVSHREAYIDGKSVTDLKDVDTTTLIYALVNAVKTLNARVAQLEEGAPAR